MKSKISPQSAMTPHELKLIQKRTGLRNVDIGKLVGKSMETISAYRTSRLHIPPDIAEKLSKIESTYVRKTREAAEHLDLQIGTWVRFWADELFSAIYQADPGLEKSVSEMVVNQRHLPS
jgi:hypothetical protein